MEMSLLRKMDARFGDNVLWQYIKFNLVSTSITLLQLLLANLLPLLFDGVTAKLPVFLRPVFRPEVLFEGPSPYVVDGVVTWGYVLPFFLSNFIANLYGYYMNMKTTFRGKGSRAGLSRKREPRGPCAVPRGPHAADPVFHLAAGLCDRKAQRDAACGFRADDRRHAGRLCAGGCPVSAGKIRTVQEGLSA